MFTFLVGISLRQRPLVLIAALLITGWGVLIARDMPIDLLPDLHPPMVTIVTEAGGYAPEEVEQLITYPMELVLNGMPGVSRIRSASSPGFSLIYVEFTWGTDPNRNRQQVTERIGMVRERLPAGVVPHLAPMSSVMGLAMQLVVQAPGMDPMALREVADWTVRPRLMAVEGVSQVYVVGGDVRQFRFTPNPVAMNMLGITLTQVEQALTAFGGNSSGGLQRPVQHRIHHPQRRPQPQPGRSAQPRGRLPRRSPGAA
ncbi:efflux RND transporter permease subunit, partial [Azospirillum sp. B506]|uniref:efflux RND transporter permease subunit n=1 Tax=Azospirillum sp. B506 TaxID=137721 RepID=UPI0005B259AE